MSTGDDILTGMDEALAAFVRDSAAGLVRSGVVGDIALVDAQPADALAMEEPALAAYDPDMPVGANGNSSQVITRNDIEQLVIAIAALYKLPPDKLAEIKSDLLMNIGVPKANFSEISTQAMLRARAASDEITGNQQQLTPQQQIEQLLNDLGKLDEKMRKQETDVVDKYGTEEQQKKLADLQKAVDEAKASGDKEAQEKAYKELFAYRAELYPELREKARQAGDWEAVRIMDNLMKDAKEGSLKTEQIEDLRAEIKKKEETRTSATSLDWGEPNKTENEEKMTHLHKKQDALGLTDDDWGAPVVASADQGKNVTMDDVSAPTFSQKQKSTDRTLT